MKGHYVRAKLSTVCLYRVYQCFCEHLLAKRIIVVVTAFCESMIVVNYWESSIIGLHFFLYRILADPFPCLLKELLYLGHTLCVIDKRI